MARNLAVYGLLTKFIVSMIVKNYHRIVLTTLFSIIISCTFAQSIRTETGVASFYHDKFVGRMTANGEIFSQEKFTAAHKTLPLGTWVKVTNLSNDSVVIVRINDRMPLWNKRSIDLTEAAASELNYINNGLAKVTFTIIPDPTKKVITLLQNQILKQAVEYRLIKIKRSKFFGL